MVRPNTIHSGAVTTMPDPSKLMGDFKVPGVDVEAVVSSQRRNIEALSQANQLALEGMQAVARRQSEIFRQMMEEASQAMKDIMAAGSPEDKAARQTELLKEAFKRAIGNMRELAEMVSKSQTEAFDVINKRVTASLDELKGVMATNETEVSGVTNKPVYNNLPTSRTTGEVVGKIGNRREDFKPSAEGPGVPAVAVGQVPVAGHPIDGDEIVSLMTEAGSAAIRDHVGHGRRVPVWRGNKVEYILPDATE